MFFSGVLKLMKFRHLKIRILTVLLQRHGKRSTSISPYSQMLRLVDLETCCMQAIKMSWHLFSSIRLQIMHPLRSLLHISRISRSHLIPSTQSQSFHHLPKTLSSFQTPPMHSPENPSQFSPVLYQWQEGVEDLENYCPGGYRPNTYRRSIPRWSLRDYP